MQPNVAGVKAKFLSGVDQISGTQHCDTFQRRFKTGKKSFDPAIPTANTAECVNAKAALKVGAIVRQRPANLRTLRRATTLEN